MDVIIMKSVIRIFVLMLVVTVTACNSDMSQNSAPVKAVVITGGHDFDEASFFEMFDSFENIDYIESRQKDDSEIFEYTSNLDPYDVIVLYNMSQKISPKRQKNFIDALSKGKGLVVLHHAAGAFGNWREYENITGTRYFFNDDVRNGTAYKASTYKHDVDVMVTVAQQHPVTKGVEDFGIHGETYKGCYFKSDNNVLLTTDEATSDKTIGWTREYGKSRVCFIQKGHGPDAYNKESYRLLVSNAIRWSARKK